jgi:hypothetical protein
MLFDNQPLCCLSFHVVGCAVILAILMVKGLESRGELTFTCSQSCQAD